MSDLSLPERKKKNICVSTISFFNWCPICARSISLYKLKFKCKSTLYPLYKKRIRLPIFACSVLLLFSVRYCCFQDSCMFGMVQSCFRCFSPYCFNSAVYSIYCSFSLGSQVNILRKSIWTRNFDSISFTRYIVLSSVTYFLWMKLMFIYRPRSLHYIPLRAFNICDTSKREVAAISWSIYTTVLGDSDRN